jgi:uncharacterized membrane protein
MLIYGLTLIFITKIHPTQHHIIFDVFLTNQVDHINILLYTSIKGSDGMKRLLNDRIVLSAVIFSLLGILFSISTGTALERIISYALFLLPGYLILLILKKCIKNKFDKFGAVVLAILFSSVVIIALTALYSSPTDIAAWVTLFCLSYRVFSVNDFLKEYSNGRVLS